jgi:hypothetical protein
MTPAAPDDLPDRVRRSARIARVSDYGAALVVAIPLLAIGGGTIADDAPGLGAAILAAGVGLLVVVGVRLRRRYGARGRRWIARLEKAAATSQGWRDVDIWFVVPSLDETHRSQRTALVAEPGGRPRLAQQLLVEAGAGLEAGRGRQWGPGRRGEPVILEKDGQPLWPSRPARGRRGVLAYRFAAAVPLSGNRLLRPGAAPDRPNAERD